MIYSGQIGPGLADLNFGFSHALVSDKALVDAQFVVDRMLIASASDLYL
jgi:hypothetical protein